MGKRILMVDDDEEICEEMAEILRDEGYTVTLTFNGLDGKRLLHEQQYDLIMLDLKLPGMSGYDILKEAKSSNVPAKFIVLSGRPFIRKYLPGEDIINKQRKEDILNLADDFINKPFDIELVLNKIKELTAEMA